MTNAYHQLAEAHGHETAAGIIALEQARKRDKVQALRNGEDQAVETPAVVEEIKLWPAVGLAAKQGGLGGAWRLWRIAHHLDTAGTGRITPKELRQKVQKALGVKRATVRLWLNEAIKKELISPGNDGHYYLVGLGKAAVICGASKVGRPAFIPLEKLVKKGWAGHVWAGYLSTSEPAPKHRENVLEPMTGVHPRTQRRYEKEAGIEPRKNYEVLDQKPERLQDVKECYETNAVFVVLRRKKQPVLYRRLPDTRLSPYSGGRTGRSRKAQKIVNNELGRLCDVDQPKTRLFYEEAKNASKAAARCETPGVEDMFWVEQVNQNCTLWRSERVVTS